MSKAKKNGKQQNFAVEKSKRNLCMQIILNLRSVGIFAAIFTSMQTSAFALEYVKLTSRAGTPVFFMTGTIEADEFTRFRDNFANMQPVREVWLSSGGGYVGPAIKIGRVLRSQNMIVRVPSVERLRAALDKSFSSLDRPTYEIFLDSRPTCESACGMILAGGKVRLIDVARTVGVHSLSFKSNKFEEDKLIGTSARTGADWVVHMTDMGISRNYVNRALSVDPTCMYYLSAHEMVTWGVINLPDRTPPDNSIIGTINPTDTDSCWIYR